MRITIVDLDWYNKVSFLPNPKCMKISSYYKQQQALVNLATDSYALKMDYDLMYVVRENYIGGGIPEEINLLSEDVMLIGNGLQFYERYVPDIDETMAACRPDYQLYPLLEENKMSKANIVQFFHNGQLLPLIQDYHNAYTKQQITYVVDKEFWTYKERDIAKCVEKLSKDKNVYFSGGLDLNLIIANKNKSKMFQKIKIDWSTTEVFWKLQGNAEDLFNFLQKTKGTGRKKIKVPIEYSGDHLKGDSFILKDFYRYLSFAIECKKRKLHVRFISPERKLSTRWFFFEALESWSIYNFTMSLVEHMTTLACAAHNVSLIQLLYTQRFWDENTYILMYWFRDYGEIMNSFAFKRWGETEMEKIDIGVVAKRLLIKGDKND